MRVRFHRIDGTIVGPFANVSVVVEGSIGHVFEIHFRDARGMHTMPKEYVRSIEIVDDGKDFDAFSAASQHSVGDQANGRVTIPTSTEETSDGTLGGGG